ncbi:hypothetical protein CPB84DRAFT_1814790 [Gymnopilus junonius]|uniref:Uncharacterized protein n=1 Tax=Gymnopilus junonius TaxID=109634 RepID=A0A9P5TNG6_GYMJU|nr:hypothetical protein CPB84DRAFT_1814790 [Gymnopilus junonius]
MSTVSLPSYVAPSLNRIPSYSAEPGDFEHRIALGDRFRIRPTGIFVKESKGGGVKLRLSSQEENIALPGVVELSKPEGVTSVEIEGRLLLREIAEGGTASAKLCLNTALLWIKDPVNTHCPTALRFALRLPNTFTYEEKTYPLPPTFDVKLSGLPGFVATIDYSVTAMVAKPNGVPVPKVKSKALGIHVGSTHVSTPFVYYPRSRPASPIPPPLMHSSAGFLLTQDWKAFDYVISSKSSARPNITAKLYVPASRIFSMSQPIPFHLALESSAVSLAAFLPLSPTSSSVGRKITRVQLMRQTTVDVRNTTIVGAKTDMWRVDCIGEGTFKHAGDGPSFMTYSGEIMVERTKIPAFRAAGLSVKDCLLFTINPTDPSKTPFAELREVIPIRLATEPWTPNGAGIGGRPESVLESPTPPTPNEALNF